MSRDHKEFTVEEKLKALYVLQEIDSNIDKIRTIRGELPMEVPTWKMNSPVSPPGPSTSRKK